jgi:hypothetical protein
MIATLPTTEHHNAVNHSGKKEITDVFILTTKEGAELEARCWMGRSRTASTVYAAFWIYGPNISLSGKGSAGGYGYHKASAAIEEAIKSAGITLDVDIHGAGDSLVWEALHAIVAAIGHTPCCGIQR